MRTLAAFVLLAAPLAAAPVPKHLMKVPEDTEQAKFQGKWKLESVQLGGKPVQFAGAVDTTFEFRGDTLTVAGTDRTTAAKFKLDVADGVKRLTGTGMRSVNKDGTPGANEPDAAFGYVIDGDKVTLASTLGGGGQPTSQAAADPARPGANTVVFVLTRVVGKK